MVRLAHTNMDVKGVHNGALYWVIVSCWRDANVLKVTTLSTRIYETSSEEVIGFDTCDILGVGRGRDGAAILNVHVEGAWIGTASRGLEMDGTWTWMWCEKIEDNSAGSRIAYAGGVLCNIPWVADSIPWMIDLKSDTRSDVDLPSSIKPFCNVPWLNDVLPFQPSCTPATHNNVNTGNSTTKLSRAINSIPIHHKSRPL